VEFCEALPSWKRVGKNLVPPMKALQNLSYVSAVPRA
jgi:hypothetical protein